MEYCLTDAREKGKSGVCMLGRPGKRPGCPTRPFAKSYGFEVVDTTQNGYDLLALSFERSVPGFAQNAKQQEIETKELTIYYDFQCPLVYQAVERPKEYCRENGIPASLHLVDTLKKAKTLPCVFNNWAVFYQGKLETVNLLDIAGLKRILK